MSESMQHHHNVARGSFVDVDGVPQPGPAPKFSRTPGGVQSGCAHAGDHTHAGLEEWGFSASELQGLEASGAIRQR